MAHEPPAAAPDLFLAELAASFDMISHAPHIGRLYRLSPIAGARRTLLKGSRYLYVFVSQVPFLSEMKMPIARLLTGFAALTALTLATARDVWACSCASSGPPCQNAFQVDAVFAGTVRSISALPDDGPPLRLDEVRIPRAVRVEFADVVTFRGVEASALSVV